LVVFLDQIKYDDTHLFEVKLPMRTVSGSAMSAIDNGYHHHHHHHHHHHQLINLSFLQV